MINLNLLSETDARGHSCVLKNTGRKKKCKVCLLLRPEFCSNRPGGVPRGLAVTRFPGTRQEEEKQNKPERAVTAWTPLKRGPQHIHEVRHEARLVRGRLKSELGRFLLVLWGLCQARARFFRHGRGLALKLTAGRLLLCIEPQLGRGRGRMEAILIVSCGRKGSEIRRFRVRKASQRG